jgi:hypothetical protein
MGFTQLSSLMLVFCRNPVWITMAVGRPGDAVVISQRRMKQDTISN